jgi:enoyl-CoA hydratase/carnithine racemase
MDDLQVERREDVGIVRLNRPERGNSVTPAVVTELGDIVEALCADDSVRAIVITGTGRVFCAGADVQEMYDVYRVDGPDGLMAYLADVWMPAGSAPCGGCGRRPSRQSQHSTVPRPPEVLTSA